MAGCGCGCASWPKNDAGSATEGCRCCWCAITGAEVGALPKLGRDDAIDRWAAGGKSLLIWNYVSTPRLDRMDIASGKRVPLAEIRPSDSAGIVGFNFCRASPDGRAHIYSAYRLLTDLFVVNGLR